MSADDYYYVNYEDNQYVVSYGFLSDDFPPRIVAKYNTYEEVMTSDPGSEYGIRLSPEVRKRINKAMETLEAVEASQRAVDAIKRSETHG